MFWLPYGTLKKAHWAPTACGHLVHLRSAERLMRRWTSVEGLDLGHSSHFFRKNADILSSLVPVLVWFKIPGPGKLGRAIYQGPGPMLHNHLWFSCMEPRPAGLLRRLAYLYRRGPSGTRCPCGSLRWFPLAPSHYQDPKEIELG